MFSLGVDMAIGAVLLLGCFLVGYLDRYLASRKQSSREDDEERPRGNPRFREDDDAISRRTRPKPPSDPGRGRSN